MLKAVRNTAFALCAGTLCISTIMYRTGVCRKLYVLPKFMKLVQTRSAGQQQFETVRHIYNQGCDWFKAQPSELKTLRSFDGLTLYADYLPFPESKKTVILCHGYRSTGLGDFGGIVRWLHEQLKVNILLIDERSHGRSDGRHITYGIKEHRDICDWANLIAREHPDHKLYLYGMSLGAASVLMSTATDLPKSVCGLVADCGFTSPDDVFRSVCRSMYHLPSFPFVDVAEVFTKVFAHFDCKQFSAAQALRNNEIPVLFIHGGADDFVPTYMTINNYTACKGEKQLVIIDGAYHANSYYVDFKRYTRALSAFIEKH